MARNGWSKEQIARFVEDYERGEWTRQEYCRRHGIPVSTLDYWRRRLHTVPRLLEVTVAPALAQGCALVLLNGRRIEFPGHIGEQDLVRLIRLAEVV